MNEVKCHCKSFVVGVNKIQIRGWSVNEVDSVVKEFWSLKRKVQIRVWSVNEVKLHCKINGYGVNHVQIRFWNVNEVKVFVNLVKFFWSNKVNLILQVYYQKVALLLKNLKCVDQVKFLVNTKHNLSSKLLFQATVFWSVQSQTHEKPCFESFGVQRSRPRLLRITSRSVSWTPEKQQLVILLKTLNRAFCTNYDFIRQPNFVS